MRFVRSFCCPAVPRTFTDGRTNHDNLDQSSARRPSTLQTVCGEAAVARCWFGTRVVRAQQRRIGSWSLPRVPGRCGCGREVREDGFRDFRSLTEYRIGGKCQSCQDDFFLGTSDRDELFGWRFDLRQGLLVGHRMEADALELALLPFVFTAPSREVAWEARFIVRAGAALAPIDVGDELQSMRPVLEDHLLRVAGAISLDAPELASLVAKAELVVAAPRVLAYLGAAHPRLAAGGCVDAYEATGVVPGDLPGLETAICLRALDTHWLARRDRCLRPGALRVCAWFGALLAGGALDRVLADRYSPRGVPLPEGEAS